MATGAKSYLSEGKRVCLLGMDTIGLSAIRPLLARLLTSVAKLQSLMVKRLSRMETVLRTSRLLAPLCDSVPHTIILYAFDLLHLDGKDLRQQTLSERRILLKALVGDDAESRIQVSEEFHGDGAALFKACAERGLEGIVSKHALAPYRSGRTRTWLKTKCFTESTFVVVGTDHDRKTGALRALLAHNDGSGLSYAGAAFIALAGEQRAKFFAEVERLTTSWAAFKSSQANDVKWCHPKLTVEVKHSAGSKTLRYATVRNFARLGGRSN
jgi:bifunctional non-homologous end joining protein LigD